MEEASPEWSPVYALHQRSYRDTSLIVELWTREFGRISVMARGAKNPSKRWVGLLQAGIPLWAHWRGRGQLPFLVQLEPRAGFPEFKKTALRSVFYLNELLYRGLPKEDPHPQLFDGYEQTVLSWGTDLSLTAIEIGLRRFERCYLTELGYGFAWPDKNSGGDYFLYQPREGFIPVAREHSGLVISSELLNQIEQESYEDTQVRNEAKKLYRSAILSYLGLEEIHSRRLFA